MSCVHLAPFRRNLTTSSLGPCGRPRRFGNASENSLSLNISQLLARPRAAAVASLLEQRRAPCDVPRHSEAVHIHVSKVAAAAPLSAVAGFLKQRTRSRVVARNTPAILVDQAEQVATVHDPAGARFTSQRNCLVIALRLHKTFRLRRISLKIDWR